MKVFTGAVSSDGKRIQYDAPVMYLSAIGKHKGKRIKVTIEREYETRSDPQNRRFFGVVIPVVRHCLNVELEKRGLLRRLSKDEAHVWTDEFFLGSDHCGIGSFRRHCSKLDTAAFSSFMAEVELYFQTHFGAVFPDEEAVREAGL